MSASAWARDQHFCCVRWARVWVARVRHTRASQPEPVQHVQAPFHACMQNTPREITNPRSSPIQLHQRLDCPIEVTSLVPTSSESLHRRDSSFPIDHRPEHSRESPSRTKDRARHSASSSAFPLAQHRRSPPPRDFIIRLSSVDLISSRRAISSQPQFNKHFFR